MSGALDRRAWLKSGGALLGAALGGASTPSDAAPPDAVRGAVAASVMGTPDPTEVWPLWPGQPPGGVPQTLREEIVERPHPLGLRDRIVRGVRAPLLTLFRPRRARGGAVLIIPGGGYQHVVIDKEGFEAARWLAANGVVAAVLRYRLPGDGWLADADAPLQDAQRALRLLRSRAVDLGVQAERIGTLGFSAGGHLAGRLALETDRNSYAPLDAVDTEAARVAFAALLYPVVTMDAAQAHGGSRARMLGATPDAARTLRYSLEQQAGATAPPMFLLHAADDVSVPVGNSLRLHAALLRARTEAELHVFATGGHGFGLRAIEGKPVAAWPALLQQWARRWL